MGVPASGRSQRSTRNIRPKRFDDGADEDDILKETQNLIPSKKQKMSNKEKGEIVIKVSKCVTYKYYSMTVHQRCIQSVLFYLFLFTQQLSQKCSASSTQRANKKLLAYQKIPLPNPEISIDISRPASEPSSISLDVPKSSLQSKVQEPNKADDATLHPFSLLLSSQQTIKGPDPDEGVSFPSASLVSIMPPPCAPSMPLPLSPLPPPSPRTSAKISRSVPKSASMSLDATKTLLEAHQLEAANENKLQEPNEADDTVLPSSSLLPLSQHLNVGERSRMTSQKQKMKKAKSQIDIKVSK